MSIIALTGGIGSGKSAVGRILRAFGAYVVDADALAREVVEPGTTGYRQLVKVFGSKILTAPGAEIDRRALGELVFADPDLLRRLEAVVHPLVAALSAERFAAAPDGVPLVYEIPLLAETGDSHDFEAVVVVDASDQVRLRRLTERGLSVEEASRRMAAQASRDERLVLADLVIDNNGTVDQLAAAVGEIYPRLVEWSQPR